MGFHAELAVVERRGIGGDQLAEACAEGARLVHESVRERGEVMRGLGIEGEKVPDLPIITARGFGVFYEVAVDARFGVLFDFAKVHRFLCGFQSAHLCSFKSVESELRSRRCCDGRPKVLATRLKNAKRAVMCVVSAICNWFQPAWLSWWMSSGV